MSLKIGKKQNVSIKQYKSNFFIDLVLQHGHHQETYLPL